jgi:peptidoglycan hydrolase-like protein with peptidoglycan-binding domain
MSGSMTSPDTVKQVQQQLSDKGLSPGPVDGVMGPKTRDALKQFQQQQGMTASGSLDQQTLTALGVDASGSGATSGSSSSGSMDNSSSPPSGSSSGSMNSGTSGSTSGSSSSGSVPSSSNSDMSHGGTSPSAPPKK